MDWEALFGHERARYEDGEARLDPEQLVRIGNAAYGAGLCLLMLGRVEEAGEWLDRAAARWRQSWEHATPTSWGRPIGTLKAILIARRDDQAVEVARWGLGLGTATAESPIGRYSACLSELVLGNWAEAGRHAQRLQESDEFPPAVADALAAIAAADRHSYRAAVEAVLDSFETREDYLEDVPVADTVLVLQVLAERRGVVAELRASSLLPR